MSIFRFYRVRMIWKGFLNLLDRFAIGRLLRRFMGWKVVRPYPRYIPENNDWEHPE